MASSTAIVPFAGASASAAAAKIERASGPETIPLTRKSWITRSRIAPRAMARASAPAPTSNLIIFSPGTRFSALRPARKHGRAGRSPRQFTRMAARPSAHSDKGGRKVGLASNTKTCALSQHLRSFSHRRPAGMFGTWELYRHASAWPLTNPRNWQAERGRKVGPPDFGAPLQARAIPGKFWRSRWPAETERQ